MISSVFCETRKNVTKKVYKRRILKPTGYIYSHYENHRPSVIILSEPKAVAHFKNIELKNPSVDSFDVKIQSTPTPPSKSNDTKFFIRPITNQTEEISSLTSEPKLERIQHSPYSPNYYGGQKSVQYPRPNINGSQKTNERLFFKNSFCCFGHGHFQRMPNPFQPRPNHFAPRPVIPKPHVPKENPKPKPKPTSKPKPKKKPTKPPESEEKSSEEMSDEEKKEEKHWKKSEESSASDESHESTEKSTSKKYDDGSSEENEKKSSGKKHKQNSDEGKHSSHEHKKETIGGSKFNEERRNRKGFDDNEGYDKFNTFHKGQKKKYSDEDHSEYDGGKGEAKQEHHGKSHKKSKKNKHKEASTEHREGGRIVEDKKHEKGSKGLGYHNVLHKDEYKKKRLFYDDYDDQGFYDLFGI